MAVAMPHCAYHSLQCRIWLTIMKVTIQIKEIDFCDVILKAMPVLHEKVLNDGSAIAKIPQDKKDEAVAYLISKNKDRIIAKLEDMLANQDIHIRLDDLKVEV